MRATGAGLGLKAAREFGDAFRMPPFRVALALSLLLHLTLLLVSFRGGPQEGRRRPAQLVQVRLLQPVPETIAAPGEPLTPPPKESPARERLRRPAAVVPEALAERSPEEPMTPEIPSRHPQAEQPRMMAAPGPPASPREEGRVAIADESPATPDGGGPSPPPTVVPSSPTGMVPSPSGDAAGGVTAASTASLVGAAVVATGAAGPDPGTAATAQTSSSGADPGTGAWGDGLAIQAIGPTQGQGTGGAVDGGGARWASAGSIMPAGSAAAGGSSGAQEQGFGGREEIRKRIDRYKVYPRIAIRNHWEGNVEVEMHLEDDGSLTAVRLLKGSGYAVLDEATITAVRRASPFPPVARVVTVPVEYRLVP